MTFQPTNHESDTVKIFHFGRTLGFIVFCFAIGEILAVFVTSIIFSIDTGDVFIALTDPINAQKKMLLLMALLSSVFRFLITPGVYLFITDKRSLSFLKPYARLNVSRSLMTVALFISIIPVVSMLIEINSSIRLPVWLSELEIYFKQREVQANLLLRTILSGHGLKSLAIVVIVVAIIPGIVEEFFFRGIIQTSLYPVFANPWYAVLVSSALFSFFHFQFYGFIPRMALGVLLGFLFLRSGNIWYSIIGHIIVNLSSVLFAYFVGPEVLDSTSIAPTNILLVPSIVISAFFVWKLLKSKCA